MRSKWSWLLIKLRRQMWFRATLFSIVAVATALIAIVLSPYIPPGLSTKIGADAVDNILGIIASSMLAVTTFSLSTMVAAYAAATSNVTPRATTLIMEDSTTQNVLATFVGSFLFSLVGIITLTTGAYGEQGRLVLFAVTICVIVVIVVTLLRWIDHLSKLGRVTETTRRVEVATIKAIRAWRSQPNLGGHPLAVSAQPSEADQQIFFHEVGYVQHIDAARLFEIAEDRDLQVYILAIPGTLVSPDASGVWVSGCADKKTAGKITSCFTIGDVRSFDQDPRFGASVLSEIASRALSPAVNDPGTAIDVITRALRVLFIWKEAGDHQVERVQFTRLHVSAIAVSDLFDDLFAPISRDGAGVLEVGLRLQKTFVTLARSDSEEFKSNAVRHSQQALAKAEAELVLPADIARLTNTALQLTSGRERDGLERSNWTR